MDIKKIYETKVSFYPDHYTTESITIKLEDFLCGDDRHKQTIVRMRDPNTPEDEAQKLKLNLPCVSIGALSPEGRGKGMPHFPTGLMCIDIDAKDNPTFTPNELKHSVSCCLQVSYCAYSARGKGVFAIMEITDPENYKGHYMAAIRLFKERLGITIDEQANVMTKLRAQTYDPDPFVRMNALPFVICDKKREAKGIGLQSSPSSCAYTPMSVADTIQAAEWCVSELERRGIDIAPTYDQWVRIGFALHELGDNGKNLFCRVSALWSVGTTTRESINTLWRSITDGAEGGVTMATFFAECAKHGIRVEYHADPEKVLEGIDLKQYTNIEPEKATSKNVFDLVGETGTIDDLL